MRPGQHLLEGVPREGVRLAGTIGLLLIPFWSAVSAQETIPISARETAPISAQETVPISPDKRPTWVVDGVPDSVWMLVEESWNIAHHGLRDHVAASLAAAYRAMVMTARTLKPSANRLAVSRSASSHVGATIGYPQGMFLARHASRTSCTSASTLGALGPSSPADAARSVGPQEDHANPRHIENFIEILDSGQRFDLQHRDQLPGRIERPDVGTRSALSGLTSLEVLRLNDNSITDISALSGLTSLTELALDNNRNLRNIQPLLVSPGLGAGDEVDLRFTWVNCSDLDALRLKGVTMLSVRELSGSGWR